MDRVLDRLWIGSSADLGPRAPLRAAGFSAVLDLRDGTPPQPPDVEVHRLPNRDGDPWAAADVEEALAFVHAQIRRGRVLVACEAGISRSAAMAVGYLVRAGMSAPEAYGLVKAARPRIGPLRGMLESVLAAVVEGGS